MRVPRALLLPVILPLRAADFTRGTRAFRVRRSRAERADAERAELRESCELWLRRLLVERLTELETERVDDVDRPRAPPRLPVLLALRTARRPRGVEDNALRRLASFS